MKPKPPSERPQNVYTMSIADIVATCVAWRTGMDGFIASLRKLDAEIEKLRAEESSMKPKPPTNPDTKFGLIYLAAAIFAASEYQEKWDSCIVSAEELYTEAERRYGGEDDKNGEM